MDGHNGVSVMHHPEGTPRLYSDLAWLWPMWGRPEEYADYCAHAMRLMRRHTRIPIRSLLDIGCGGGKNAYNLKRDCEVTGLDLSPVMLAQARDLNPECEFVQEDMRSFSLNRTFDAVLMNDSVSYMLTPADLRSAFESAWRHLNPGGVMVATPDETRETFVQNNTCATTGSPAQGQASGSPVSGIEAVFIENNYDPDPLDDTYETTMIYLIREGGRLRVETDRHVLGLFALDVWRETLTEAGFGIHEDRYEEHGRTYVTFACLKRS